MEIINTVQAESTAVMYRRIGSTTYKVRIHFSDTAEDTLHDKILHLIQNEDVTNMADYGILDAPQMSCQPEGSTT